jgi:hypothetical protein
MSQVSTARGGGNVRSAAAERRARGEERRRRAAERRQERAERLAKRSARRAVRLAERVFLYVDAAVGFLAISKRQARLLVDRLGARLLVRTTGGGEDVGLEVIPF